MLIDPSATASRRLSPRIARAPSMTATVAIAAAVDAMAQKTSAIESGKAGSWNRFTGPCSSKNAANDQMRSANRVPRAAIPGGQADRIRAIEEGPADPVGEVAGKHEARAGHQEGQRLDFFPDSDSASDFGSPG